MKQRIKIGDVYVEIPGAASTSSALGSEPQSLVASKANTPEPMEEQPYVYQPNDPFRHSLDQARAVTSISRSHKPWVQKTWFVLFVIGPLFYAQVFAFATASYGDGLKGLWSFLTINAFIVPIWLIYFSIWRRNVRSKTASERK